MMKKIKSIKNTSEDLSVEINNAGIILLHPFLVSFFETLNLIENKDFINEASRRKGVQLLHFLAFQNEKAERPNWILNKILCGMERSDFVPIKFEVSNVENEECKKLLHAVINHWKQLKNTSVDAFRSTFLNRNGLLKKHHDGYILVIQRTALDILLNSLPWSLNTIELPWNRKIILVEW